MRTVFVVLLMLSVQLLFGQATEYFTSAQVDSMVYLPEDAVKVSRSIRKKRKKKGLPASTPELRFLQAFYSKISIAAETRLEEVDAYRIELELLVDSLGTLSVGDVYFLNDAAAPRLPKPLLDAPLVVSAFSTGGVVRRNKPEPSKEKPEWSIGQLALAVSVYKAFISFPSFIPAQLDGAAVGCRWTVHLEYRNE